MAPKRAAGVIVRNNLRLTQFPHLIYSLSSLKQNTR